MAKKNYNYNEIYIASTEKSALTGNAGFGVRAATQGMSPNDAQEIANFFSEGYRVPSDLALTHDKIIANPEIVYDFTPTFVVREVKLSNGRTVFVIARTVYIGIDYGFFTENASAQRAGANYFTHLLVFDEKPPIGVIESLSDARCFVPNNYSLRKDNPELKALLTGEPPILSPGKSVAVDANSTESEPFGPEMGNVITGLLQMHTNIAKGKTDGLAKIMVKAHNDEVPQMLFAMGRLPQALTKDLAIVTNYMDQGMPLDYNMVFVNEYNNRDLYEEYNICADTRNDINHNIDKIVIFDKIKEFIKANDQANAERLIKYYLSLDPAKENDYDFLYKLFVAVESDLALTLDDITAEFLAAVPDVHLEAFKLRTLWEKINAAINAGLQSGNSGSGQGIVKAISVAADVNKGNPARLSIDAESQRQITRLLFGRNTYFDKLITPANCDLMLRMVDVDAIESPGLFFNALHKSASSEVWNKMIRMYYGQALDNNFAFVIDNVFTSPLKTEDKPDLVTGLYPMAKYENDYMNYILDRPESIRQLGHIVSDVCFKHKEDVFIEIIARSNYNKDVIESLAPAFKAYFDGKLDATSDVTIRRLLAFIDKIGSENALMLDAGRIIRRYVESIYKTPPHDSSMILDSIISSGITLDKETGAMLTRSKYLLDQRIPDIVKSDFIVSAYRMRSSQEYIESLFKNWLRTSKPDKHTVKELLSNCPNISSALIETLITSVWEAKELSNRDEIMLAIVDNTHWSNKKDFVKHCKDKALVAFLTDNDKFFTKMFRKLFK